MRNHVLISFISILFSMISSANAVIPSYPYRDCFMQPFVTEDTSSLETLENNLKSQQMMLQNQITKTNQRLQSLQQFLSAQKALKINWVNFEKDKKITDILYIAYDGRKAEICRAKFLTGIHPGLVSNDLCAITYGGYSLFIPKFEVLAGKINTQWRTVDSTTLQNYQNIFDMNADLLKQKLLPIQAGFENGIPLYICKTNYNNSVKIGKVNHDICNISDGDKEITVREFEVLFGERSVF